MGLFDWVKKKTGKDETVFCWKCNQVVKLKDFRVAYIGVRQIVEGDCPKCGSVHLKPHLPPEKYG
jgi:hypothetical protein